MKKIYVLFIICFQLLFFQGFSQDRTDTIHAVHYDLHLNIINLSEHQISGYADVKVVPKITGIPYIDLDLIALTVDSLFLNGNSVVFTHTGSLIRIPVTGIDQGDTQVVRVHYHGTPVSDPDWGGYFFSNDNNFAYNVGVGMSMIPPTIGRVWFPCLDDFKNKATYTFHIRTDADKRAVCNGLLTDSITLTDQTRIWKWELPYPIATYVTACAVGNFQLYEDTIHGLERIIPVNIYAPASVYQNIPSTFIHLKDAVHIFEALYGPYVWQRVGYTIVPFTQGAMEHVDNICYPMFAVNGTTAYESLMIHELVHMWFGNQITPSGAEQLWLKEGFAVYSEIIANEYLDPTGIIAPAQKRDLHRNVIKTAHLDDGDYYALDNIPQPVTYGTTTYDKGGLTVHSLRGYLGDSLFYNALKILLIQEKFGNLNSEQFFIKMSQITGINLIDFYEGWIHQPGFLHFSIDSIRPTGTANQYQVHFRQKLHHANNYANSNRVDVEFVSQTGARYLIEKMEFDGATDVVTAMIPFQPAFYVIDPKERLGDALFDYFPTIDSSKMITCADAYFRVKDDQFTDTSSVYVAYNLAEPDPLKTPSSNIYRISDNHYWRVEFYEKHIQQGSFHFRYLASLPTSKDYTLMQGYTKNDLLLLYRRDPTSDWRQIPFTVAGNNVQGYLITNHTEAGEYLLAVGQYSVGIEDQTLSETFSIFPTPADSYFQCRFSDDTWINATIRIYTMEGKLVMETQYNNEGQMINIQQLAAGHYIIKATNKDQQAQNARLMIIR